MLCLICRQAHLADGFTSIPFERDETKFVIKHVPAQVCPSCSEAYVDEQVGARLLHMVNAMFSEGMFEGIREYDENY